MPTHVTEAGDKAEGLAALHKRKIQARYNKLQTARKTASALGGGGGSSSRGRRKGTSDTTLGNDSHGYSFLVVQAVIRIQRNCRMRLARMERRRRIRDRVMGRAVASHRQHGQPRGTAFLAVLLEERQRSQNLLLPKAVPKADSAEAAEAEEAARPRAPADGQDGAAPREAPELPEPDILVTAASSVLSPPSAQPTSRDADEIAATPAPPMAASGPSHEPSGTLPCLPSSPRPASERSPRPRGHPRAAGARLLPEPRASPRDARSDARSATSPRTPTSREVDHSTETRLHLRRMGYSYLREGGRRCCPTSRLMRVDRVAPALLELRPHSACLIDVFLGGPWHGPWLSDEAPGRGGGGPAVWSPREPSMLSPTPAAKHHSQVLGEPWESTKHLQRVAHDVPMHEMKVDQLQKRGRNASGSASGPAAETHFRPRARQPHAPPPRPQSGLLPPSPRATAFTSACYISTTQSYYSPSADGQAWRPMTSPIISRNGEDGCFLLGSSSALNQPPPVA